MKEKEAGKELWRTEEMGRRERTGRISTKKQQGHIWVTESMGIFLFFFLYLILPKWSKINKFNSCN